MHHNQLVEKHSDRNRYDEPHQLGHDQCQIVDAQNFAGNDAANADWRQPHDARHHAHDHIENGRKEVDDHLTFAADRAQQCAEYQRKENDAQRIGAGPILNDSHQFRFVARNVGVVECVVGAGRQHWRQFARLVDGVRLLKGRLEQVVGKNISGNIKNIFKIPRFYL